MSEDVDREEMAHLLEYANYSKVAEAIGVKRAAVSNWSRGVNVTPARLEQVRAVLERHVQTEEAAPPEWARRLVARTIAIQKKLGITDGELAKAEAEATVLFAHLLGAGGKRPRPRGGGGAGATAG